MRHWNQSFTKWFRPHSAYWFPHSSVTRVGWLEFNVTVQHKYGYIRDETLSVATASRSVNRVLYLKKVALVWSTNRFFGQIADPMRALCRAAGEARDFRAPVNTIIKTTSVCDGDARSVGGGHGWLACDTDGLAGWPVTVSVVEVCVVDTRYRCRPARSRRWAVQVRVYTAHRSWLGAVTGISEAFLTNNSVSGTSCHQRTPSLQTASVEGL